MPERDYTPVIVAAGVGTALVVAVAAYELFFAPKQVTGVTPPAGVATLVLSGPSASTLGTTDTYSVAAADANGNPVSGTTVYFYVNGTQQTSAVTDDAGTASFSYTPTADGTYEIYASTD